jgi:hypothetical protein
MTVLTRFLAFVRARAQLCGARARARARMRLDKSMESRKPIRFARPVL